MTISFDAVKDFYEYLIIDDDGWVGLRDDAPKEAVKAYEDYLKLKRQAEADGDLL